MKKIEIKGKILRCTVTEKTEGADLSYYKPCQNVSTGYAKFATYHFPTFEKARAHGRAYLQGMEDLDDADLEEAAI